MTDVSIIIPTYNRARFLPEAVDSALAQGGGVEVIVVDDGSTDDTAAVLERYRERIRVLQQSNQGPSAARNLGAEAARGRYLFFADSDDLIEPGAMQRLLQQAQLCGPAQVPFGIATTVDEAGRPCQSVAYGFATAQQGEEMDLHALLRGTMPLCLTLLPAAVFRQVGGLSPALRLGEDQEFALRVHAAGFRYVATGVPTIKVRLHNAPRLSGIRNRDFGSRAVQLWSTIAAQAAALPEFDERAREVLAGMIWTAGRDAARARSEEPAKQLFAMATSLNGNVVRSGPLALRLLSMGVGAYRAERGAELMKRLIRRR